MEDLQECCVCLEALSAEPVSVLLCQTSGTWVSSCSHYIHTQCAARLRPARCPLCRATFRALSEPLSTETLVSVSPEELVRGLRRLCGARTADAPSAAVLALLAATLPVSKDSLLQDLPEGDVCPRSLASTLSKLGVTAEAVAKRNAAAGLRLSWWDHPGIRWLDRCMQQVAVKLACAAGSSILLATVGLSFGALAGCLKAVPRTRVWQFFEELSSWTEFFDFEGIAFRVGLLIKGLALLRVALHHGSMKLDLVYSGLKRGLTFGALAGALHGLFLVNSELHSPSSIFWAGLSGSTLLGRQRSSLQTLPRRVILFRR